MITGSSHLRGNPDLAVMMFDLRASGVVRNALRVAKGAQAAGLTTELWVGQSIGPLRAEVPENIPIFSLGLEVPDDYTRAERKAASLDGVPALAALMSERQARLALSAGNHFHGISTRAFKRSRPPGRLIGRVSNALPGLSLPHLRRDLMRVWKARQRLAPMHRLIAVSAQIQEELHDRYRFRPEKVRLIRNGIDLSQVETLGNEAFAHPWFAPGTPPVVLGVGRLVPQKGFDVLLKAFALARRSQPMRLVIAGDGPRENREQLQALANDLGIGEDVWLAGFIANPLPLFRQAKLFVLSSRWEGMSNVLLEALASGCPVVATQTPGTSELLGAGRFGHIVPADDPRLLAGEIEASLRNPIDPRELRRRAAEFDLRHSIQEYVGLFEEELAASSRA